MQYTLALYIKALSKVLLKFLHQQFYTDTAFAFKRDLKNVRSHLYASK